jgi:hypothetical protein
VAHVYGLLCGLEPEYYFFQVTDTDMPEGKHFRNNNKGEK